MYLEDTDPYASAYPDVDVPQQGYDPYARIRQAYASITGGKYTPTDADVSQWGTNIDDAYMGKIQNAIGGWWTKYQAEHPPAPPPVPGGEVVPPPVVNPPVIPTNTTTKTTYPEVDHAEKRVDDAIDRTTKVIDTIPTEPNGTPNFYPDVAPFQYDDFHPQAISRPDLHLDDFNYPDFALPGGQEVLDEDPGYGIREKIGERAITNNALARGLGKSTGTLKALADYAGASASQEYGAGVDRRFRTWDANRGLALDKWNSDTKNKLTNYGLQYGFDTDQYGRAEDAYKTNLGKAATEKGFDLDIAAGKAGGRQGASTLAGNLALGSGNLSLGHGNLAVNKENLALTDRNSLFDRLLSLYDISTRGLPSYPA